MSAVFKCYRVLISPVLHSMAGTHSGCRFYPSCSQYAEEAVEAHGYLKGLMLSTKRLLRCHPFSSGGYDAVPVQRKKKDG